MSSDKPGASDIAIRVHDISKHYVMFERPEDRFKQMVVPRLERLIGRPPRRYFRDFAALSRVSFEVGRGETVGIIGRNGSGKSTLLQIICGTLQPTSGSVEVNGRIAALLELGAGFNPEFTGRENVFLNASILGVPRKEMEWRFDEIARFADIGPFMDQPVKTYSSGMYVRLAFATAINVDPDILIVDEALSVGDEAFQRKCFARIEDIKDKGGTILFVSHGAQTIVQLCTRAILLDGGEKILEGKPKAVTGQYQRLVNASADGAAEIRSNILSIKGSSPDEPSVAKAQVRQQAVSNPSDSSLWAEHLEEFPGAFTDIGDYLDDGMQSQSIESHEVRGARIHSMRVLTLSGKPVNVLRLGRRYVFEYQVDFIASARDVGFGIWIRTTEGYGLGGAQTIRSPDQRTKSVSSGQSISVRWEFSCSMLPGVYFLSSGVSGTRDSERIVMHRIVDAVMVRVAPEIGSLAVGRVDFGAQPYLSTVTSRVEDR
ncbi:ABC transporter ATP-binding protein [Mesorhizobium sp. B2-3-14]|uniref:ABC transporter ATP-binding protein n=1 Tax=unclassified Mesorhizobium TaxID=325217 RepID=UPI00112E2C5D|nr:MULTISPECIES: ABC transporter ATP-binding protein [unclassified Mesorhizobium]TPK75205.1 ABC transporter ATP-binding protein [Mesorhizobium sp. B2-4-18]TPL82306.1 ABC transporter ATP-binding protein [Mesorhizobium sp. B2-3-14]